MRESKHKKSKEGGKERKERKGVLWRPPPLLKLESESEREKRESEAQGRERERGMCVYRRRAQRKEGIFSVCCRARASRDWGSVEAAGVIYLLTVF